MKLKTKDIAEIALFSALIAVCSWITIPGAVPFTMQTFAVFTACGLLGGPRGLISVIVYILIGLVGVPVYSGFGAGPGVLFGVTGGYIIGFIGTALIMWMFERKADNNRIILILSMICGLIACYAVGTAWFMYVYTSTKGAITLGSALSMCVVPFILPDAAKIALAAFISGRLKKLRL